MLHPHPLKRPTSSSVNPKLGTSPLGHVHVSSTSACAMLCDHSGSTPVMRTMPAQLRHTHPWNHESRLRYNSVTSRLWGWARLHLTAFLGYRLLSQTHISLFSHFVLTRAHPRRTSRSVTHSEIALGQACLTSEFFGDGLPEKKL
jgi:hypothetical protein